MPPDQQDGHTSVIEFTVSGVLHARAVQAVPVLTIVDPYGGQLLVVVVCVSPPVQPAGHTAVALVIVGGMSKKRCK